MNREILLTANLELGLRRNDIKRLTDSFNKFGFSSRVVKSDKFYLEKRLPYAMINLTGNPNSSHLRYIRTAELAGVKTLNRVYDVIIASDKGLAYIELESIGVNVPKTIDLPILQLDPYIFDYVEETLGFPCVIKMPNLGYGIGVFLVKTKIEFEDLYMMLWACASRSGDYFSNVNLIAQEYLPDTKGNLIKVYILDNKIIGCYHQSYPEGNLYDSSNWKSSWRFIDTPVTQSNTSHTLWTREKRPPPGLVIKQVSLEQDQEQECLKIFKHFNLNFGSLDLILSKNKYHCIDINSSPGLGLCYMVGQETPIGDRIVQYLMKDIL